MQIERKRERSRVEAYLSLFPVTAILGPRQCGKSTLAGTFPASNRFDLENPRDLAMLATPQTTLESLEGLVVIDEIQRKPELFALMRYLVDQHPDQRYLILGSASRELIRQSSESLAGRIGYHELTGFGLEEVGADMWRQLWVRGGLPRSYLAPGAAESLLWRQEYITTFLERDIPQLGIQIPAQTLRRFWIMVAHYHGQVLNYSELARSFGISDMTARHYLDILSGTFMVRLLSPWHTNAGKRLVKRPKLYLRDSGLFHALLHIGNERDLHTHNKLGASWEGFVLENLIRTLGLRAEECFFWATHSGAEVDLFWMRGGKNFAAEIKFADAPRLTPSMRSAVVDLDLERLWVIYPGDQPYTLDKRIQVLPLHDIDQLA
jgi:predicted AAA+ superfamily ATPase